MRISDWSSDVCSSDLFPADKVRIDVIGREHLIGLGREDELVRVVRHVQFLFADQLEIVALERTIEDERIVKRRRTGGTRLGSVEGKAWRQLHAALTEIGRASCRERVCEYG